mmetsp:Transcript_25162/g.75683  ORF Transcript_25162/g.75683 Transcript_25162/m.75683 type:complete len:208 (+) Transcript_25162:80-703(+)
MSDATLMARCATSDASRPSTVASARAAASAYAPPDPMPIWPSAGSRTSPLPVSSNVFSRSATRSVASRRRRYLSVRQALASATHARVSWFGCSSSFCSRRSSSVNASAVDPAKPTRMSAPTRRTFRAFPLTTMEPMDTWPSPIMQTLPPRRTQRIVVPCMSCAEKPRASAGLVVWNAALPLAAKCRHIGAETIARSGGARPSAGGRA